ncbi:MAG: TetR/AcrR family transcriptional regulator [Chloroflexota bacterium]
MAKNQPSDSIQEILTQARRAQILNAAARVFAERGYHRATIRQVAECAGIADGTIYNYFENKADLLLGILDHLIEVETDEGKFEGLSAADFRQTFGALMHQRLEAYFAHKEIFRAILPELLVDPVLRERYHSQSIVHTLSAMSKHLEARAAGGHIRPVNYRLTARALTALHIGLIVLDLLDVPMHLDDVAELPEALVSLLYEGLKPDEDRGHTKIEREN